jgi:opacity protein-like surface antigen
MSKRTLTPRLAYLRPFLLIFTCVVMAPAAQAQTRNGETPAVELFGGYSYARIDPGTDDQFNGHGFDASVAASINKYLGLEGDFSRHYSTLFSSSFVNLFDVDVKLRTYTVMGGPRFTFRSDDATIFVHALLGVAHARIKATALGLSASADDNAFAMALGGGVDVNVHRHIAIRVVQADYVLTNFGNGRNQNNARLSAGIVIRLGSR